MRTLGIDLASQPVGTAACRNLGLTAWRAVETVDELVDDDWLSAMNALLGGTVR